MSVISIRSAVCVLGGFPALAGADLDVSTGEIVHVCGPNGAGKTTLLRVVAGLVGLRSGSALVLGSDLTRDRTAHRHRLALVGHESYGYDDLTVTENLAFSARAAKPSGGASGVAAVIERVEMTALADVRLGELSAGQRRRFAIAAALVGEPELLLLDEPHAGLDQAGRALIDEIVVTAPERGRTVLMASHETERAAGLATRSVEVVGGQVRAGIAAPAVPASPAGSPRPIEDATEIGVAP